MPDDAITLPFSQELEQMSRKIILRSAYVLNVEVKEELRAIAMRLSGAAFYVKQQEPKS